MAWAKNGTPNTLSGTADDIDITDLTARTYNQFMIHLIASGNIMSDCTLDNNGNTDYARRTSANGSEATGTSETWFDINHAMAAANDKFSIFYIINIDSEEKLIIGFTNERGTAGAASAPNRLEFVNKVDTSTNSGQFTRIDCNNDRTGDYATDSNFSALGTD